MQLNFLPELDNQSQHLPVARYQKSQLQAYQGNELIEALPKLGSAKDIFNRLLVPQGEQNDTNIDSLSAHERAHLLAIKVEHFFFPTEQHFELAYKYDLMLRQGYSNRAITDIPGMEVRNSQAKLLFVKGPSGEGKTQALTRVANIYEQVIVHKDHHRAQIVHLGMRCPVEPTIKSFCYSFFESLQRVSKTDVMVGAFSIRNEHELFYGLKYAIERNHLGMLVIDDIENLFSSRLSPMRLIRKIVELSESTGLPIILSGSAESEGLFKSHAKITFDVLGTGSLDWKLLPLLKLEGDKHLYSMQNWESFVSSLWEYQVVKVRKKTVPDDFCETLFELSQGIPKVAVSLFVATQLHALYSQKEEVTVKLLKQIEKKEFGLVRSQMEALGRNDAVALRSYEGLSLPSIDSLMFSFQKESEHRKTRDDKSIQSRVLNFLVDQKVKVDIAKEASTRIVASFPDVSIKVVLEKATEWLKEHEKEVIHSKELNKRVKKRKVTDEDRQEIESTLSEASKRKKDVYGDWFDEW
tara:strand:+ start:7937 stop:9508 length:1572 start_codon:yes stop_codon:yes gene_type:complete